MNAKVGLVEDGPGRVSSLHYGYHMLRRSLTLKPYSCSPSNWLCYQNVNVNHKTEMRKIVKVALKGIAAWNVFIYLKVNKCSILKHCNHLSQGCFATLCI
ncbi:hypothetical protein O6P43_033293 [Quillaja saponaria]|uniref:Uncharacterized protein n=1 Tax=Quillaja saponaria TaxID=32244 RepID=A0AAD7KPS7_QUISA|nr:hypothetical protein O6P43_033293 [Quillaja saponaria]